MTQPLYTGVAVTPFVNNNPVGPLNPIIVNLPWGNPAFANVAPGGGFIAGDNLLVAPSLGSKIRVFSVVFDTGGVNVNAFFKSGTGPGTRISATGTAVTGGDFENMVGLFETVAGEGLYLNLSVPAAAGTAQVGYYLVQ